MEAGRCPLSRTSWYIAVCETNFGREWGLDC